MTIEPWTTAPISDLLSRPLAYGVLKPGDLAEDGVPLVRIQDVHTGRLDPRSMHKISAQLHHEYRRTELRGGELLLSIVGTVGKVIEVPASFAGANISRALCVLGTNERVETGYLKHFLVAQNTQDWLQREARGNAQVVLNLGVLRTLEVPLPTVPEQRKIAAILSSVDAAIESTQAVIDQLGVVKKAMMAELLTRGLPGRHTKFKQTEIGEVPEGWEVVPLGDLLLTIDSGWSPQCESDPARDDEWGVLKVSAVSWGEFNPRENKRLPSHLEPKPQAEVRSGDLLVSRANTPELVGKCVLVRDTRSRLMLSDKLLRLRVNSGAASASFLRILFDAQIVRQQIEDGATGSSRSMRNLSQEKLRQIRVMRPPIDEQIGIAKSIELLVDRVLTETAELDGLRALKSALMSVLLTGEVRVTPDEPAP